jgi:hypothetical protein
MKNIITKLAASFLVVFSANAFAEKIIITGQPITLEKQGNFYVTPKTYKLSQNYQYVIVDGKERACFLDKKPDLVNIDVVSIDVQVGDQKATWNCYSPDPTYFVIQR